MPKRPRTTDRTDRFDLHRRIALGIALAGLITGCGALREKPAEAAVTKSVAQTGEIPADDAPTAAPAPPIEVEPAGRVRAREHIVEMGGGAFIAEPSAASPPEPGREAGDINLTFDETELKAFVKAVLGDLLKESYVIDPKVSGSVTMTTARPLTKDELFPLLEEILAMNGAAIVLRDGIYHVLSKADARQANLSPVMTTGRAEEGYGLRIVPLRFVAAEEMQKILQPFLRQPADLRIDAKRNLLIISGTRDELALAEETIAIFDVDWLRGMSVGVFPLDFVDPGTLKSELDTVLGAVSRTEDATLGGLVRTVALERLNSLLLISSTPAGLREAETWLRRLDRPGEATGQNLYVYEAQNAKAVELAEILGQIFRSGAGGLPAPALAPGLTPVEITSGAALPAATGTPIAAATAVEIIADDRRNALVILATAQEYKMVETALRKLDVVPLQVLIEASILEVTLRDNMSLGVEWFFKNNFSDKRGRGTLDLGSTGISALSPSFSYTIIDSADQVRAALNALSSVSEVNVLSAPALMVLDNQTAVINVGDEIPVPTRQSVGTVDATAPLVNEIQFRKTGVTLSVTPRVNASGLVTMDIRQEVSTAVATTTSELNSPTIQNRSIESVVAINSGDTIVLGGLIQDTQTETESGLPVLHKIPLIGKLFGQESEELLRTELVVLITPKVVRNRGEAQGVTEELRRKLHFESPGSNG
jgi:general secretion pathway protein D